KRVIRGRRDNTGDMSAMPADIRIAGRASRQVGIGQIDTAIYNGHEWAIGRRALAAEDTVWVEVPTGRSLDLRQVPLVAELLIVKRRDGVQVPDVDRLCVAHVRLTLECGDGGYFRALRHRDDMRAHLRESAQSCAADRGKQRDCILFRCSRVQTDKDLARN